MLKQGPVEQQFLRVKRFVYCRQIISVLDLQEDLNDEVEMNIVDKWAIIIVYRKQQISNVQ